MVEEPSPGTAERWRPIPFALGAPAYEVSDLGRIRSWKRRADTGKPTEPRILTLKRLNNYGHLFFESWERSVRRKHPIHRTVLEVFVGSCPENMECCHNDGNPANNRLDNLRWDTHKNNYVDSVKQGRTQRGEKNSHAVLTARDVYLINRLSEYINSGQAADIFGVSRSTIIAVTSGRTWSYDG